MFFAKTRHISKQCLLLAKSSDGLTLCKCLSTSSFLGKLRNESSPMNIFDRRTKTLQRERAATASDVNVYDYLKDEIGYRLADRVYDIKRKFNLAADIGKTI